MYCDLFDTTTSQPFPPFLWSFYLYREPVSINLQNTKTYQIFENKHKELQGNRDSVTNRASVKQAGTDLVFTIWYTERFAAETNIPFYRNLKTWHLIVLQLEILVAVINNHSTPVLTTLVCINRGRLQQGDFVKLSAKSKSLHGLKQCQLIEQFHSLKMTHKKYAMVLNHQIF